MFQKYGWRAQSNWLFLGKEKKREKNVGAPSH
jgi:hypothetical protein